MNNDDLVEKLRARVEERRANGDYPDDLEEKLDEHFRRIAFHRIKVENDGLDKAVASLDANMDFAPRDVEIESGLPGGAMLHRAINKAMIRQRQSILTQVSEFAEVVRQAVHELADAVKDPHHVHVDLTGRVDAILERLDSCERHPVDNAAALGDLRRRVELLERQQQQAE